jgi:cation:H+ antiporter
MGYELAFNLLLIAVGIFILIRSGVYIVRSLIEIAHFLKIPEFTLSFILMAFATTLPEFAIGLNAAFKGEPLISLGNILGANILTLGLTLGLVALISGKLIVSHKRKEVAISHHWFTFFLGAAPIALLTDLKLSRVEGIILILFFLIYLMRLIRLKEVFHNNKSFWPSHFHHSHRHTSKLRTKVFLKNLLIFAVAVAFLLFSAFLIVSSAKMISFKIGMSEFLVGALIVALGTTLPELCFGLRAAISRHGELSLGNLFGAAAFNATWILGIVALIKPIEIKFPFSFLISAVFMVLVLFLANLFLQTRQSISRKEGMVLIGIYILFVVLQLVL